MSCMRRSKLEFKPELRAEIFSDHNEAGGKKARIEGNQQPGSDFFRHLTVLHTMR